MDIEGSGRRAPAPLTIKITPGMLKAAHDSAVYIASGRASEWKNGRSAWSKGLAGSKRMPVVGDVAQDVMPIYIGNVGEIAFSQLMNQRLTSGFPYPDTKRRKRGDGGVDFVKVGVGFQVKTKTNCQGDNLIRRVTSQKRMLAVNGKIAFVGMWWDRGYEAAFLGWQWLWKIQPIARLEKAKRGDHFNLAFPNSVLLPIDSLVAEIAFREIS